jgi:hypothetical protein
MTQLPSRRDRDARTALKPRPDDAAPVTRLPVHRHGDAEDRHVVQPRTTDAMGFTKLPEHRHNDKEVMEIRRREALRVRPPLAHLRSLTANPFLIGLGYTLAAGSAAGGYFVNKDWQYLLWAEWCALAIAVLGMMVAVLIAVRKPRSRHHAAFISIIALLDLVFIVIYLVQLQFPANAT